MRLVPTTAGFGTSVGKGVVMVSPLGVLNRLRRVFGMSCWFCLVILVGLLLLCWGGELPLRYCSGKFACRVPTWGLPSFGHVQRLIAEFAGEEVLWSSLVVHAQLLGMVGGARVLGGRRILGSVQRVRLHRKNPSTPCRIWQGWEFSVSSKGSGRD